MYFEIAILDAHFENKLAQQHSEAPFSVLIYLKEHFEQHKDSSMALNSFLCKH